MKKILSLGIVALAFLVVGCDSGSGSPQVGGGSNQTGNDNQNGSNQDHLQAAWTVTVTGLVSYSLPFNPTTVSILVYQGNNEITSRDGTIQNDQVTVSWDQLPILGDGTTPTGSFYIVLVSDGEERARSRFTHSDSDLSNLTLSFPADFDVIP